MILDLRLGCIEKKHIPQIGGEDTWLKQTSLRNHSILSQLLSVFQKKQFPSIWQKITGNKKTKCLISLLDANRKKHHITLGAKTCCIKVVLFATSLYLWNVPWLKHRISWDKRGIQKCGFNPPHWGIFSHISSISRQNLYHSFKILTCVVYPQKLKMIPSRRGGE